MTTLLAIVNVPFNKHCMFKSHTSKQCIFGFYYIIVCFRKGMFIFIN